MEIDFETDRKILQAALKKWGSAAQEAMAIEEMAELIQALLHGWRGRDKGGIVEEIADVQIMLWQLAEEHDRSEVQGWIELKLQRLAERLHTEKSNSSDVGGD